MTHPFRRALPWLLLALAAAPAHAQLVPCAETASGEKVYLDDVRARGPQAPAALEALVRKVAFKLDANLSSLEARTAPGLRVLSCAARWPGGDAVFTPTLCQNLASEKVLLEVWSEVHLSADSVGRTIMVVDLFAALPPLIAKPEPGAPAGVVALERRCPRGATSPQILRSIDAKDVLLGLARVAAGQRELSLGHDGPASGLFCEGARVLRALADPDQRAACGDLAAWAERLAARAQSRLQAAVPGFVTDAAGCGVSP